MPTPDIFLSYNREDAERARHFADAFAGEGFDVWWDVELRSGEAYDTITEEALRSAKAVVVLWSKRSVDSRWVRAEATLADRAKTLVPAMIEPCERPIMFELTQTADLIHWDGEKGDPAWQAFVRDVHRFVDRNRVLVGESKATAIAALPSLNQLAVAVLPFANLSGDSEQDYFADGITEDVITDLSKISALRVIARNSVFAFKGRRIDVRDVARQLNVTHVVEGSVRKAGSRVRVSAQLIDGSTNSHVWAERYDREMADIFDLQDELSLAIVAALKIRLLPEERPDSAGLTPNLHAYDLWLQAKAMSGKMGALDRQRALSLYREALSLDPAFIIGWTGYAFASFTDLVMTGGERSWENSEALRAATKVIELAPQSFEAAVLSGTVGLWRNDWEQVQDGIDRARAAPMIGSNTQTTTSLLEAGLGYAADAVDSQLQWCKADPLSLLPSYILQRWLDVAGRSEQAWAEFERSKNLVGAHGVLTLTAAMRALADGAPDLAASLLREIRENETVSHALVPILIEALGTPDKAGSLLRAAYDRPEWRGSSMSITIAKGAVFFGEDDLAISAMRRGLVEQKVGHVLFELWSPNFVRLRQDPRFKTIVSDMGLADFWRRTNKWNDFARPVGENDFELIA